jgi:hypothetical protein
MDIANEGSDKNEGSHVRKYNKFLDCKPIKILLSPLVDYYKVAVGQSAFYFPQEGLIIIIVDHFV